MLTICQSRIVCFPSRLVTTYLPFHSKHCLSFWTFE